jgi:hypothetical protein
MEEDKNIVINDTSCVSPKISHINNGEYVVLMETNAEECESWYYFIRKSGNEEALKYLSEQIEQVDWYTEDDLSVFDMDLENVVSAKTAKEMTKLEINAYAFHRKFDGKLKMIDLGFKKKDKNMRMMEKTFDILGYGQIEDYISDEDLDEEDLTENESDSETGSETESASETESDSETDNETKRKNKGIPPALLNSDRPGWAKAKGKRVHKRR